MISSSIDLKFADALEVLEDDEDFNDSYVPDEHDLDEDDEDGEDFQDGDMAEEDEIGEDFSPDRKSQVKIEARDYDSDDEPLKPKLKRGPGRPRKSPKPVFQRPKRAYVKSGKSRKYVETIHYS